ncbi:MAG: hypothetical protein LQ345_003202 [Seirophora villosa]|nr:MAG: hypothetical protein LQ345_003202 [Seirophora villosa]
MNAFSTSARAVDPTIRLENSSAVDYESTDEIDASEYQVNWTNVMAEGQYLSPSVYQKVEVLMLCWEEHSGDIDTRDEVSQLKAVFEESFGYHVTIQRLDAKIEKKLQIQVNAKVANFVEAHDGPNTLLIVYYAGHGKPGKFLGDLEIFGRFEYLAATKDQKTTAVPGPNSFTSALIWALEALRKQKPKGRFTTDELLRKIKTDAPDFPKHQTPDLSERDPKSQSGGRIMLHPLQADRTDDDKSYDNSPLALANRHIVTLHFDFGNKPSEENLKTLGQKFNEIFERNTLGVQRVRWGGVRVTMFTRATRRFSATRKRKRPLAQIKHSASSTSCYIKNPDKGLLSPQTSVCEAQDSIDTESSSPLVALSVPSSDRENHHGSAPESVDGL